MKASGLEVMMSGTLELDVLSFVFSRYRGITSGLDGLPKKRSGSRPSTYCGVLDSKWEHRPARRFVKLKNVYWTVFLKALSRECSRIKPW
jgi:hypothetical protein